MEKLKYTIPCKPKNTRVDNKEDRSRRRTLLSVSSDANTEAAIIGACLLEPEVIPDLSVIIQPKMMKIAANRVLFESMVAIYEKHGAMDVPILFDYLRAHDLMQVAGTESHVLDVIDSQPSAANSHVHAEIIRGDYYRRRVIKLSRKIADLAEANDPDLGNKIITFADTLKEFDADAKPVDHSLKQLMADTIDNIHRKKDVIPTGLRLIDANIGGIMRREVSILAARPSHGKTTTWISRVPFWIRSGYKVLVFSLEVSREQMLKSIVCCVGKINRNQMKLHGMTPEELQYVNNTFNKVYKMMEGKLALVDTARDREGFNRHIRDFRPDIIIVDYIQRAKMKSRSASDKNAEIESYLEFFDRIIKEVDSEPAALIVSQLNREQTKSDVKRPALEHLKGSGSLEEYACDAYLLNWKYRQTGENKDKSKLGWYVSKSKYSPICVATLTCEMEYCRVYDKSEESQNFDLDV